VDAVPFDEAFCEVRRVQGGVRAGGPGLHDRKRTLGSPRT
jgi:hypothetical protein